MGKLTTAISGKLVAFDTAPLIYYIEEHPEYLSIVDELFGAFDSGYASGTTSVLTMHEVLVKPLRDGRQDIADKYREVLTNSANVTPHPIDYRFAELRRGFVLSTPGYVRLTLCRLERQSVSARRLL